MMMRTGFARVAGVCLTAVALGGCTAFTQSVSEAEAGVVTFHEQLGKGQFEQIYDASEPEFKKGDSAANSELSLFKQRFKLHSITPGCKKSLFRSQSKRPVDVA